ncbi:hypothetical protein L228DRAFT_269068 [Xylona heveae TC161]|uniref:Zinc/iron permease n=1 Tax=Xylona heveae (strain CBS 132557 / TC161) TaxID=1328760 RepID=A0A165G0L3_XYLHT|nr:hypothetical protein L228DRAFT_269068 [Xylona heveae TC161]KZF21599.1 hypothetical protein L228DRAFT_269068 [Xylona heveae TC161]
MVLDNDTRGWIMTCVSGVACILGACIICVDLVVQLLPGKKGFRIQDSNAFLSASLSLSFGVMLFSALYGMLPSAKKSLRQGGFSPQAAEFILIGCFIGGVIGIQILSRLLHRFIPSHVVDCDHSHAGEDTKHPDDYHEHDEHQHYGHSHSTEYEPTHIPARKENMRDLDGGATHERSPLLSRTASDTDTTSRITSAPRETSHFVDDPSLVNIHRPSLQSRLTQKVSSIVMGSDRRCGEDGQCYGLSEPCGQECRKVLHSKAAEAALLHSTHPPLSRSATVPAAQPVQPVSDGLETIEESPSMGTHDHPVFSPIDYGRRRSSDAAFSDAGDIEEGRRKRSIASSPSHSAPHHHHVPTNAFLSIGLQTSIAIALHKLPEGFITYATNHANPQLGFAVFIALFIHNITEGFAMALPLYLAIGVRWKAIIWSSFLGGVSQPLGAGIAALSLKLAGRKHMAPGEGVYGGMFAVTAGIMTSVAFQLFSESIGLSHSRGTCIVFAFIGIAILGISFALTAS